MSHTPHAILEDFPDKADRFHELKTSDKHFAKLADEYHEVNRAVHCAETGVEPTDDANMQSMRKQRMILKDEIWRIMDT